MEPAMGVLVGGRYHLRRPLGKGGMASVWMAYDRSKNELVAVKFMSEELAREGDARLRFEREAIAPQQIDSPYVVRLKITGLTTIRCISLWSSSRERISSSASSEKVG